MGRPAKGETRQTLARRHAERREKLFADIHHSLHNLSLSTSDSSRRSPQAPAGRDEQFSITTDDLRPSTSGDRRRSVYRFLRAATTAIAPAIMIVHQPPPPPVDRRAPSGSARCQEIVNVPSPTDNRHRVPPVTSISRHPLTSSIHFTFSLSFTTHERRRHKHPYYLPNCPHSERAFIL